jgi:hypothetical protein
MVSSSKIGPIQLQKRDLVILRGLYESRIMTPAHIAAIYFEGRKEAAKKRLQKLKAVALIKERKRRVNEPSILFLTPKGYSLLDTEGGIFELPKLPVSAFEKRANVSELTIRHELEVMDVKAAFYSALRKSERFHIAEFSTWPKLHQFNARSAKSGYSDVLVKPDGFIRIHEKEEEGGLSEHVFFLEVDRSTETQNTLVSRVGCYLEYYKSGGFAVANNAPRTSYKEFPFRVLIVLKSSARLSNTAERLLHGNPPIRTLAYLSTFSEGTTDPIGKVWICPSEATQKIGLF